MAQGGRRRGLGRGLAHGPGQVSQGLPPFRGRRLLLPVPSPACLHRLPLQLRPRRTRPARRPWRSAPRPPSCWCAMRPSPRAGRPSRCSWCGATSARTSWAAPTCFPAGPWTRPTGAPGRRPLCVGRTDAGASALLGIESGGLAYWVAVVRETFEEAGLLLARREDGRTSSPASAEEEARFAAARVAVNKGTRRFLDLCRDERLRLTVGEIHYFAHWITPRGAPRRYDTRFFVAAAPPGQVAAHDAGETIAEVWISPDDALARHRAGEIEIIFPTIRNLQVIGRFATSAALLAAAEEASSAVPAIEPRVVPDGNGMRIVLPGDPGYERGAVPDPDDGTRAWRLQRGGARGLPAGQRGGTRRRTGAPPARFVTRHSMIPAVPDFGIGPAPEPGRLDEVAPGVLRLTAPNPGLMTGPGTNTYLVGGTGQPGGRDRSSSTPGPADPAHRRPLSPPPLHWGRSAHCGHAHPRRPRARGGSAGRGDRRPCRRFRPRRRLRPRRASRGGMDALVPGWERGP